MPLTGRPARATLPGHPAPAAVLKALPALALCFALAACDSGGGDLGQDPALLVGTWTWERSTFEGLAEPSVGTPATTSRTETVVFRPDGTFAEFGVDHAADPPEFGRGGTYAVRDGSVYAQVDGREEWLGTFAVGRDQLVLSTAAADGPTKEYRRAS